MLFQTSVGTDDAVIDTVQKVAEQSGELKMSFFEMIKQGGWIIIPLVLLSVWAIFVFVERYIAITKAAKKQDVFMNSIKDSMQTGNIDSARNLCKSTDSPLARMIGKGISRLGRPLNDINAAIENVGKLEVSKLEKNVASLAMVAGVAPMIGFLGTVSGMIRAFYDMANAGNGNIDIATLSGGIYEAMVTTLVGLFVGIIGYIAYNIIVSRVDKVVYNLEAQSTEFMDILHEPASN